LHAALRNSELADHLGHVELISPPLDEPRKQATCLEEEPDRGIEGEIGSSFEGTLLIGHGLNVAVSEADIPTSGEPSSIELRPHRAVISVETTGTVIAPG